MEIPILEGGCTVLLQQDKEGGSREGNLSVDGKSIITCMQDKSRFH